MVNLTRIYTRTGDDGTTSLGDMSRPTKNDSRLVAYAEVDEANCVIGVALATCQIADDVTAVLQRIQNELFDVGADLCTPVIADPEFPPLRVEPDYVERLESEIDQYNAEQIDKNIKSQKTQTQRTNIRKISFGNVVRISKIKKRGLNGWAFTVAL